MGNVCALIQTVLEKRPMDEELLTMIHEVLSDAGFIQVTNVVQGKSVGHYRDSDGSSTGETFTLNSCSGLVAMVGYDEDKVATSWLDSLWGYIAKKEAGIGLVEAVQELIDQSVPLKPIVLTEFGEALGGVSTRTTGYLHCALKRRSTSPA